MLYKLEMEGLVSSETYLKGKQATVVILVLEIVMLREEVAEIFKTDQYLQLGQQVPRLN